MCGSHHAQRIDIASSESLTLFKVAESTVWPSRAIGSVAAETSGADQRNRSWNDFIGPLYVFPLTADRMARLSQTVDGGLQT